MVAIQQIAAEIGRVTGAGIARNLRRHYPRPLLWAMVSLLLIANIINLGADLGAMGAALALLAGGDGGLYRSEEHTSELQSLMRISYAVFCLKKKTKIKK